VQPDDLTTFVKYYQHVIPFRKTYENLLLKKRKSEDDDVRVVTTEIKVPLYCQISTCSMETPVKGQWCEHLGCVDLKNFVDLNRKNRMWKCPECVSDRPVMLYRDEFMYQLLELAKAISAESDGVNEAVIDIAEMTVSLGSKGPYVISADCIELPEVSPVKAVAKVTSPVLAVPSNSQT
jgi:hypothetical protein